MITLSGAGTIASDFGIASMWEWWEPSRETAYVNNDPMGTLTGQFAGKNFTAAGASRPIYKTGVLNGLAVADYALQGWNGVDASALTAGHILYVVKAANDPGVSGTNQLWRIGTSASLDAYTFTDGIVYMGAGSSTRRTTVNPTVSVAAWRVLEIITTSSEYTVNLDGTQLFTSGTNTVAFSSDLNLGKAPANTFTGQGAGLYIFSAKLSSGDRTAVINYINSRFGLSVT